MPAATKAGSRPRSHRGGSARTNLAYDLGRSGDPAPSWIGDHPEHRAAYERGVDDLDAAQAGAPPRTEHPSDDEPTPEKPAQPQDQPSPSRRSSSPAISFSSGSDIADSVSSALLGLLGYALLVNFVRGGSAQVRRWVWAKATNGDGTLP